MTSDDVLRLAELESELADAALRVMDVSTKRESHRIIGNVLVRKAKDTANVVREIEGTVDPYEIARNHLEAAATDDRPAYVRERYPDDIYAQKARERAQRLPEILRYLGKLEEQDHQSSD